MRLFFFRMKDGNSAIICASDQRAAEDSLTKMGLQSSVASARELTRFVAHFILTDAGDLQTTLLDAGTLNEVSPDYPFLHSARAHSYADFGTSNKAESSEPVLFDDSVRTGASNWHRRDKDLIAYAVKQERERFSN
jgi:hypothetical protein